MTRRPLSLSRAEMAQLKVARVVPHRPATLGPNALLAQARKPSKRRKAAKAELIAEHRELCASLSFTLPNPPSSRDARRLIEGRIVSSTPKLLAYRAIVAKEASGFWLGEAEISVCLDWFRPQRSGDLDNRAKVILDALQGVAYKNDSQIVELHMRRFEDKRAPRVEVTIEAMPATKVAR